MKRQMMSFLDRCFFLYKRDEGWGEKGRGYLEVDVFGFGVGVNLAHDFSSTRYVFFV